MNKENLEEIARQANASQRYRRIVLDCRTESLTIHDYNNGNELADAWLDDEQHQIEIITLQPGEQIADISQRISDALREQIKALDETRPERSMRQGWEIGGYDPAKESELVSRLTELLAQLA